MLLLETVLIEKKKNNFPLRKFDKNRRFWKKNELFSCVCVCIVYIFGCLLNYLPETLMQSLLLITNNYSWWSEDCVEIFSRNEMTLCKTDSYCTSGLSDSQTAFHHWSARPKQLSSVPTWLRLLRGWSGSAALRGYTESPDLDVPN